MADTYTARKNFLTDWQLEHDIHAMAPVPGDSSGHLAGTLSFELWSRLRLAPNWLRTGLIAEC